MSQLDDALEKAKALISIYEGIKGNTEIPKVLSDALAQNWELVADDAIADVMTIYHKEDQELDAQ